MKKRTEQERRKSDVPGTPTVREDERAVDQRGAASRPTERVPLPCGPDVGGIFARRSPMWHPAPNLF